MNLPSEPPALDDAAAPENPDVAASDDPADPAADTEPPETSEPPEETDPPAETDAPDETDPPAESEPPEETDLPEPVVTGMEAFVPKDDAPQPNFVDVPAKSFYAGSVSLLYRLGLVTGVTKDRFGPTLALTAGECAALSVRIYALYHGITPDLTRAAGERWDAPYMRAAEQFGIIPKGWNGAAVLTREQSLYLLYRMLPASELQPLRSCSRIPGLYPSDPQYQEILCLYDAGILTGTDAYGTLDGDSSITRAQYITLLARLVNPAQRKSSPLMKKTGMAAFETAEAGTTHPFTDVRAGSYYADSVGLLYNLGLVTGTSATAYSPESAVTRTQVVTLAVRVYETYHGLDRAPKKYSRSTYLALGREYGILPENWGGLNEPATRAEVAFLIARTLPAEAFPAVRGVPSIPDVPDYDMYYPQILLLYRAGVLGGSDRAGTFHGSEAVSRAEFATMFVRAIDPARRLGLNLSYVEDVIRSRTASYPGDWSVFVMDVNTGLSVSVNPKRMWSASIVKLYVMGAVMEALENGTLQNSQTIQNQLRDMITWSSNDAWKSLASKLGGGNYSLGMSRVNDWCDRNGYPDSGKRSTGKSNTTSAEDTGLFLLRVLQGTNVSAEASAQMLSLLKQQQRTSKIPAGVPSGVVTANKTGELNDVQNDAAIIFAPYGTYILVVLTGNGYILHIRDLSTAVYNAMQAVHP